MRFRKKPIVIEAFKFVPIRLGIGAFVPDPPIWFSLAECHGIAKVCADEEVPYCVIDTLEGQMKANAGDWIIRGVKGELYPIKDEIFKATYDPVEE